MVICWTSIVHTNSSDSWSWFAKVDVVFELRRIFFVCWASRINTSFTVLSFWESFSNNILVFSIPVCEFNVLNFNSFFIPVSIVLSHFNRRLSCDWFQNKRSIVQNRRWICRCTKAFPFWFKEIFVDWHHHAVCCFVIPESFWLVQCIFKCVIVNSFYTNSWKVVCFTFNVSVEPFNWRTDNRQTFWFSFYRMFQPCHKVLGFNWSVFFSFSSNPLSILTDFISVSQTVLWNCPWFSNRWYKVAIFIVSKQTIYRICRYKRSRINVVNNVIQCFRINWINVFIVWC